MARKTWQKYLVGNYAPTGPAFVSGKNATLHDRKGRSFIDMAGGVAVSSLGHGNKALSSALAGQAKKLIHLSNLYVHNHTVRVARKLVKATGMERAFFCNSGAEANECALKIARKRGVAIARGKHRVISLSGSFHGRLGLALAASGQPKLWKDFGPQPPGFVHVPLGDEKALRAAFSDKVCAAIVEPIQGEAGIVEVPASTLKLLGKLCARHDALLIIDEIQTGMGRTGKLLASKGLGLRPDVITMGKGIGGGFPVAAALVANKAADVLRPGDHGTTYGGNALALVAVETALGVIDKPGFLARVREKGRHLRGMLRDIKRDGSPLVTVRGKGLMLGLVVDTARASPAQLAKEAMDRGVLVIPTAQDVVRLVPPLTITRAEMKSGVARLRRAFGAFG